MSRPGTSSAECHSTDLRKRYDPATNRYATTWAELTVSCEECHARLCPRGLGRGAPVGRTPGGARRHRARRDPRAGDGAWVIKNTERGIAEWTGPPRVSELDVCARCHARRRPIVEPHPYGQPFLDTHVPALLEPGLYHVDGQALGEVYEWGSFVQSRMQRAGVTCSDCHDPHRARPCRWQRRLRPVSPPGPVRHAAPPPPSRPVGRRPVRELSHAGPNPHGVDPRRDHSFRVPRPDLSVSVGTPNACTGCHRDRPPEWAADRIQTWGGRPGRRRRSSLPRSPPRDGDSGRPALVAVATDRAHPAIARATAFAHFPAFPSAALAPAVESGSAIPEALVRLAALRAAEVLPPERRGPLTAPLLRDPVRAVRLAAAHAWPARPWRGAARRPRGGHRRMDPVGAGQRGPARGPVKLANLYARLGRAADAESALRSALCWTRAFCPPWSISPTFCVPRVATPTASAFSPRRCARPPSIPRRSTPSACCGSARAVAEAIDLLRRARPGGPSPRVSPTSTPWPCTTRMADAVAILAPPAGTGGRETLAALATYVAERGDVHQALAYADKLVALDPNEGSARALVESPAPARSPRACAARGGWRRGCWGSFWPAASGASRSRPVASSEDRREYRGTLPAGSYTESCRDMWVDHDRQRLEADSSAAGWSLARRLDGPPSGATGASSTTTGTSTPRQDTAKLPAGSYRESCRDTSLDGRRLSARCRHKNG